MLIFLDRVEDTQDRGGGGADHEQDDDGDKDNHEHPLLRVLENLLTVTRSGASSMGWSRLRGEAHSC